MSRAARLNHGPHEPLEAGPARPFVDFVGFLVRPVGGA